MTWSILPLVALRLASADGAWCTCKGRSLWLSLVPAEKPNVDTHRITDRDHIMSKRCPCCFVDQEAWALSEISPQFSIDACAPGVCKPTGVSAHVCNLGAGCSTHANLCLSPPGVEHAEFQKVSLISKVRWQDVSDGVIMINTLRYSRDGVEHTPNARKTALLFNNKGGK